MSVYFFYRCPYEAPVGSHLRRFPDASVLDWFRARWQTLSDTDDEVVYERVTREMGCEVYGFFTVFAEAAKHSWPPPATAEELSEDIRSAVYGDEVLCPSAHLLQVNTDDDEIGLAYYFFDDHYLARHARRAAFLLRDDWHLPGGCGPGGFQPAELTMRLRQRGRGKGTTYVIDLDDVGNMNELVLGRQIDGVRLPDLMQYLACSTPSEEEGDLLWLPRALLTVEPAGVAPAEAAFLRHLREQPGDDLAWGVYSDWLEEHGQPPAGLHLLARTLAWAGRWYDTGREAPSDLDGEDLESLARWSQPQVTALERLQEPSRSLVHVADHVAQLALHHDVWKFPRQEMHVYHEWIYFDDLWASAYPDLANAILRYVHRWDVLSTS